MHIEKKIEKLIVKEKYEEALHLCETANTKKQSSPTIRLQHARILHKLYRYKEAFDIIRTLDQSGDTLITEAAIIIDWCSDFLYKNYESPPYELEEFIKKAINICDKLIAENKHKLQAMYFKLRQMGFLLSTR